MLILLLNAWNIDGNVANRADPDQTAPKEQSDQDLHCLVHHVCPNT